MSIAQDRIYRVRVNNVRDLSFGGPVIVKDATTGRLLRESKKPLSWEDITEKNSNLRMRINLRKDRKK